MTPTASEAGETTQPLEDFLAALALAAAASFFAYAIAFRAVLLGQSRKRGEWNVETRPSRFCSRRRGG